MSAKTKRSNAGTAVAGLFANPSATGGLAGRETDSRRGSGGQRDEVAPTARPRIRVGVELTEEQSGYLRSLSRPDRTHGPRTLGTKFVATGVLVAAIELIRTVEIDMYGVVAGDEAEMAARAREALLRAAEDHTEEVRK